MDLTTLYNIALRQTPRSLNKPIEVIPCRGYDLSVINPKHIMIDTKTDRFVLKTDVMPPPPPRKRRKYR